MVSIILKQRYTIVIKKNTGFQILAQALTFG